MECGTAAPRRFENDLINKLCARSSTPHKKRPDEVGAS